MTSVRVGQLSTHSRRHSRTVACPSGSYPRLSARPYTSPVVREPAIANRQEALLCLVAAGALGLASFLFIAIWLVPWRSLNLAWVYFVPIGFAAWGGIAWVLFASRVRARTGDGPKVFGGNHLRTGRRRRGLLRLAWQVANTGRPSSATWDEVVAEAKHRDAVENRRREIEHDLDRRPYS